MAGYSSINGSNTDFSLIRLNADGTLDTGFGGNGTGKLLVPLSDGFDVGSSITVQPDGKIVVAGRSINGSNWDFSLIRLNADGSLDSTFNAPANPANTLGGAASYTANSAPVLLDGTAAIFDAELATQGHYAGATVILARSGGASAQDVFGASGALIFTGSNVQLSGIVIGTLTQAGGTLVITFNAQATQARVNEALSALTYANTSSSPPASVTINWTFNDGNAGVQGSGGAQSGSGSTVVNITLVNYAPVISHTAVSKTVNENSFQTFAASDFGFTDVNTGDTLQSISIVAAPVAGQLFIDTNGDGLFGLDDTLLGNGAVISAANIGKLTFRPVVNEHGSGYANFTWTVNDGTASSANVGTMTFNVTTQTQPTQPTEPTQPTQPTQPTEPTQATETVDGIPVSTRPGDGGTTITRIPVIPGVRTDDPNSPNPGLADISIVRAADGHAILQVGLPTGVGLQAQGVLSGLTGTAALNELLLRIELAGGNTEQLGLARIFDSTVNPGVPLNIQTLTLATGADFDPNTPIVLRGSLLAGDGQQAIVLDARALPPGSVIQVDNIEFIAVIGNVRLIGGAGQNFAAGDNSAQWMVLGAGDDVLHGGAGNDTVGSLGGNDQVFGDAGDDIVFGGTGNDALAGGTGNDRLDGGLGWDTALQSGALTDYTLRTDSQFLVLTHKTTGEVDRLKSIETVKFDTGANLYIADSDAEAAMAHIVTRWLGREVTVEEGVWAQKNSSLTDLQVAQYLLGAHAAQLQGRTAQELVAGWKSNAQIVRMEVASELVQGRAGLDTVNYGLRQADVHLARTGTDRWEGTSLIDGDMAEFVGIERLHLKDVSVALDTQGTAGKVAALLSVTLGNAALSDRGLAGEGLKALDAGMSVQAVGEIAMRFAQSQQGHQFTAQETVQWLWTRATGSAGTEQQLQAYVQQLQGGQISTGDLVNAAVHHALANPSAQLVGVLDSGLLYTALA